MKPGDKKRIEKMAAAHGLGDFKWIQPRSIVLGEWVRMKCLYGCPGYGSRKTCPPFVPSVAECRDFFGEYRAGILFHFGVKFENPDMRHAWSNEVNKRMLEFEREVFLSGFQKAFLFPQAPCRLCGECSGTDKECRQPSKSRPTLEAFGVDVYTTARIAGFPIQVVKDYNEEINRYGLLLLE